MATLTNRTLTNRLMDELLDQPDPDADPPTYALKRKLDGGELACEVIEGLRVPVSSLFKSTDGRHAAGLHPPPVI